MLVLLLNGQTEDSDNAVDGLVFPLDGAPAVRPRVPHARAGRVQRGAGLLHQHAGHCRHNGDGITPGQDH